MDFKRLIMKNLYNPPSREELIEENLEWLKHNGHTMTGDTFSFYDGEKGVEIIKVNNTWILKE